MKRALQSGAFEWVFHPILVANIVWHVLMRITILYLFVLGMNTVEVRTFKKFVSLGLEIRVISILLLVLSLGYSVPQLLKPNESSSTLSSFIRIAYFIFVFFHATMISEALNDPMFINDWTFLKHFP